ncbi:MAG: T9SS type A sorting domain-containing protein [Ignavibacteriales bacterium]|nr:T9SS type A sorting domain-containing protein [Ignavibacteriales bacterium]
MNKYFFPLLILFCFLFYHNSINSQTYKVTGRILTDSQYVSHAAVVLYNSLTNSVVDSVITDSLGYYQLNAIVGVEKDEPALPTNFELAQNYPNPFNPTTKITFTLSSKDVVRLKVYDILGREVAVLADGLFEVGKHEIEFNASRLPSGVYFYNLTTSSSSVTKKMLLLK